MTLQVVLYNNKKEATKAQKNPLFPEGEIYEFLPYRVVGMFHQKNRCICVLSIFVLKLRTNAVRQQIDAFLKGAFGGGWVGFPKKDGGTVSYDS